MRAETEHAQEEIRRLQGCINDLIGILAFPAIWTAQDSSRIVGTLLDALLGMLRLDFVYARVIDPVGDLPVEHVRSAQRGNLAIQPQDFGRTLAPYLTAAHPTLPLFIPNPIGEGKVSVADFRLGLQGEIGVLVAASHRADFPTKIETLLLRVAANQAAIALQEARRVNDQILVAEELERRVAERTRELTAANEELTTQMAERKRAEAYVDYQANLLANVHDAILATDDQFNLTAWNRAAEEMYGWKAEEVLGQNVENVIRSEINATQRYEALEILAQTGHYHANFVQYRRDGWRLWIQGDIIALGDEAGQITGYVCAFRDVTKRKQAEAEALALKDELAAELTAMTRLHEMSTRLLASTDLQPLLEEVLDATMVLLNADFGNIQLYNSKSNNLEIVAQRGFRQDFLDYFNSVHESTASCGMALLRRERVVVDDVLVDPSFAPHLQVVAAAGYRAVQSTPLFSRSGEPLGMISTHFRQPHHPSEHELRLTDLYARQAAELIELKRAEETLRATEERFRSYFELGLIGMAITSPDKGCIEVNDELCRILGYERSELLQMTWAEITHPDDLAEDVSDFDRVIAGKIDGYTMDKRWIRKDGRIIDTITAAKCLRRADGSVDYFVGLVQDITDRKLAEESLRKAHETVDMIVNSISDQFIGVSSDWRFTYFNNNAAEQMRVLGKDPVSLIGKVLWDEFPYVPDEEAVRRAMSERVPVTDELYYAPLGEWVENHIYPTSDGGLVIFQRYVTERKRTEEALKNAQAELAHAARVTTLGELTASIAHEVNQPLAAIVTNGQASLRLLARDTPDLDAAREAVEAIINDGIRASEVIKRIRALMEKSTPEKAPLDINETIREVIALSRAELARNQVSVRTVLEPDLSPVLADRVQVQQVVLNLVLNANEAMAGIEWGPRELLISSERYGSGGIVVTVRDCGIGFSAEDSERIFDAFFTTKTKDGGLGMGLSISRTIIEGNGGKLWATPNEGKGATFRFTLPID
jgi:PAS domain S-box-containing protein